MKKLKRGLALILAIALVMSNGIYSMSSSLQANQMDASQFETAEAPVEETVEPEINTEGVDVNVPEQVAPVTPEQPTPEPAAPEQTTPEQTTAAPEQPVENKFNVIVNKPTVEGGVLCVWTTGDKTDVTYDENKQYKQEITEGALFSLEITAKENYEVEKVTDQSGNVIKEKTVNEKVYTYEFPNLNSETEIHVTYKEITKNEEAKQPEEEKKPEESKTEMPAQTLNGEAGKVTVKIDAPEGALPEGTTLNAKKVSAADVEAALESQAEADGKQLSDVDAVEVTLQDKDGNTIQPKEEVTVTLDGIKTSDTATEAGIYSVGSDNTSEKIVEADAKEGTVEFQTRQISMFAKAMMTGVEETTTKGTPAPSDYQIDTVGDFLTIKVEIPYSSDATGVSSSDVSIVAISSRPKVIVDRSDSLHPKAVFEVQGLEKGLAQIKLEIANNGLEFQYYTVNVGGAEANTCEVKFDPNGASGDKKTYVLTADASGKASMTLPNPSDIEMTHPKGYMFAGWSKSYNGQWNNYVDQIQYTFDGPTTMYAIWLDPSVSGSVGASFYVRNDGQVPYEPSAYNGLLFSPNSGDMPNGDKPYFLGKLKAPIAVNNNPEVVKANLQETPSNEELVSTLAAYGVKFDPDTQVVEWYVIKSDGNPPEWLKGKPWWHVDGVIKNKSQFSVGYSSNSGNGNFPSKKQHTAGDEVTVDFNTIPERVGYTFLGWDENKDAQAATYTKGGINKFTMPSKNVDLYAIWTAKKEIPATIKYQASEKNGGKVSNELEEISDSLTGAAKGSKATASEGWEFVNWTDENNTEVSKDSAFTPQKSKETDRYETQTYTANFKLKEYSIKYDLDNGAVSGNPESYTVQSGAIALKNPTKKGHQFLGWSGTDLDGVANKSVVIPAGATGDREYRAYWVANKRTISYWTQNSTYVGHAPYASYRNEFAFAGEEYTLVADRIQDGFVFRGWSYKRNGHTEADIIKEKDRSFTMPDNNLVLYGDYTVDKSYSFDYTVEHLVKDNDSLSSFRTEKKYMADKLEAQPKTIPGYKWMGIEKGIEMSATGVDMLAMLTKEGKFTATMSVYPFKLTYKYEVDEAQKFDYNVSYVVPADESKNSKEETQKLSVGAQITAEPKVIEGYKVSDVKITPKDTGSFSDNKFVGTMPNEKVEIVYSYVANEKQTSAYNVKYIVSGNDKLNSEEPTQQVLEGEVVSAAPKTIPGYKVSKVKVTPESTGSFDAQKNFSGKMPAEAVTVTYTYELDETQKFTYRIEYFVGSDQNPGKNKVVETKEAVGSAISAKPIEIEGYKLTKWAISSADVGTFEGNDFKGVMPGKDVTVTYTYDLDEDFEYDYEIVHKWEDVENPEVETLKRKVRAEITAEPKKREGYVVSKVEISDSGLYLGLDTNTNLFKSEMPENHVKITYTYRVDTAKYYKYTVKHMIGEEEKSKEETYKLGNAEITAVPKNMEGYVVTRVEVDPANAGMVNPLSKIVTGKMLKEAVTVTYYYEPLQGLKYNLRVQYLDSNGDSLANESNRPIAVQSDVKVEPRNISGYKAKAVEVDPKGFGIMDELTVSGKMPAENINITYIYEPDQNQNFTYDVSYQSENVVLDTERTQTMIAGTEISARPRDFAGYVLSGWEIDPTSKEPGFDADGIFSGNMPGANVKITYLYEVDEDQIYPYTVNYYQDDEIMDRQKGEVLVASPTVAKVSYDNKPEGYILEEGRGTELPFTVSETNNEIDVYYAKDVIGEGENPDEGDEIPDIYQAVVSFVAENGTFAVGNETVSSTKTVVTLRDADGKPSKKGTGRLKSVPEATAKEGYVQSSLKWKSSVKETPIPKSDMEIGKDIEFAASFLAEEPIPTPGEPTTPPTPDAATPATPDAATPATPDAATPATPDAVTPTATTPVTPAAIVQTILQPVTALVEQIGDATTARVEELVPVDDEGVPLANRSSNDHKCCILHFLLMLLALVIEIFYTRSMKKRQQKIFELEEELAMVEKEEELSKTKENIA